MARLANALDAVGRCRATGLVCEKEGRHPPALRWRRAQLVAKGRRASGWGGQRLASYGLYFVRKPRCR